MYEITGPEYGPVNVLSNIFSIHCCTSKHKDTHFELVDLSEEKGSFAASQQWFTCTDKIKYFQYLPCSVGLKTIQITFSDKCKYTLNYISLPIIASASSSNTCEILGYSPARRKTLMGC